MIRLGLCCKFEKEPIKFLTATALHACRLAPAARAEKLAGLCRACRVPFVYDAHHHRCLPDTLSLKAATQQALKTRNREPLFHLSSHKAGWAGTDPRLHHDYIDIKDFPACWRGLDITIEIEAKAKELAIARLRRQLTTAGVIKNGL